MTDRLTEHRNNCLSQLCSVWQHRGGGGGAGGGGGSDDNDDDDLSEPLLLLCSGLRHQRQIPLPVMNSLVRKMK